MSTIRTIRSACAHRGTLLLLLATLALPTGRAAVYHFSTSGNDTTGDGSADYPWQSLTKATAMMVTSGTANTIRLKRGDTWYLGASSWSLTGKHGTATNPIIVEAWGDAPQLPIVAHLSALTSGWTVYSGNVWQHALPGYSPTDCFLDGNRLKLVGSPGAIVDGTQYAVDTSAVYVYATSDPGPNHLVETNCFGYALSGNNLEYLTFRNLQFSGGRTYCIGLAVPTSDVTFDSIRITRPGSYGLGFLNGSELSTRHTRPRVVNSYLEMSWATYLNSTSATPNGNGIYFQSCDEGLIQNNTVVDFGHTSIALAWSSHCLVERNVTYPIATNYYRALEVYAGPVTATDAHTSTYNVIRRNVFLHQRSVGAKLCGQYNRYYSNLFVDSELTGVDHNEEGDGGRFIGTGETVHDNLVVNNTFYGMAKSSFSVDHTTKLGPAVQQNTVANNLFLKWSQAQPRYGISIINPSSTAADQIVQHNGFWNTSTTESVIYDMMAPSGPNGSLYTAAQANASIPNYGGNVQVDPQLIDPAGMNFDLSSGSPVALAGKDLRAVMGDDFVDFDGHPWASTPSIGAFQYTSPSVGVTTLSANTYNAQTRWVGLKFTVGSHDLVIARLGRWVVAGNGFTHRVKLFDASTGTDVAGGLATVATTGAPPGTFAFAPLATPITLPAGGSYYLLSEEAAGGDAWYGYGSILTSTSDFSIDCAAVWDAGVFSTNGTTGNGYGPVAFKTFDAHPTPLASVTVLGTATVASATAWRGLTFTVGSSPLTIGSVGRWVLSGNSQSHTVKLVAAATGLDLVGGSAVVTTAGATAGQFAYAKLVSPLTLAAGTTYYLVSEEFAGGDIWADAASTLVAPSVATIDGAVTDASGAYVTTGSTGNTFGPVGLKY